MGHFLRVKGECDQGSMVLLRRRSISKGGRGLGVQKSLQGIVAIHSRAVRSHFAKVMRMRHWRLNLNLNLKLRPLQMAAWIICRVGWSLSSLRFLLWWTTGSLGLRFLEDIREGCRLRKGRVLARQDHVAFGKKVQVQKHVLPRSQEILPLGVVLRKGDAPSLLGIGLGCRHDGNGTILVRGKFRHDHAKVFQHNARVGSHIEHRGTFHKVVGVLVRLDVLAHESSDIPQPFVEIVHAAVLLGEIPLFSVPRSNVQSEDSVTMEI